MFAQLLDFVRFTHLTHKVGRVARISGTDRMATVVEHSYQLTLLTWYLIDTEKLELDRDLVIKYALIHDLVETYAGDTYFYDEKAERTKHEREQAALVRIKHEFPDFEALTTLITRYEKLEDPESCFVYALDKLIDPLNIYLEDGKLWHEKGVTLPMLLAKKEEKVQADPTVARYFSELKELLLAREQELFPPR
jgi:putative hydrolases of HD superfamily